MNGAAERQEEVAGVYREEAPRWLVWSGRINAGLAAFLLVVNLAEADVLDQAFRALWLGGALLGLFAAGRFRTVVEPGAVTVVDGIRRTRRIPWEDVAHLVVAGRFEVGSVLVLRSGRRVLMRGLPRDAAAALARERGFVQEGAAEPPRRAAPGPDVPSPGDALGGPHPDDDLDLEGPFRRGPRRR